MEKIGPCPIFFIFYFQKLLKKQNFLKILVIYLEV
ncbi:hypothetical protein MCERE19_00995 [Spirosomataceae bacterium]|jgi:hypothetical protein